MKVNELLAEASKISDAEISDMVDDALVSAMDGGDPMDTLADWMRKNHIDMDRINNVVNKEHRVKGGLYAYIARTWQDMQNDNGEDSSDNPWGSTK